MRSMDHRGTTTVVLIHGWAFEPTKGPKYGPNVQKYGSLGPMPRHSDFFVLCWYPGTGFLFFVFVFFGKVSKMFHMCFWGWKPSKRGEKRHLPRDNTAEKSCPKYSWAHNLRVLFIRSVKSNSFATPWTVASQAPLSVGSPSKHTGVGCRSLLQGIFLQRLNPGLLHWQVDSFFLFSLSQVWQVFFPPELSGDFGSS